MFDHTYPDEDTGPMRASVYARISPKPGDAEASVERQILDSRAVCERNGWEIVAEHVDTRRSAWQRNRSRPGWDALLASIRRREVDVIVVYHPDRLMRQPWDFEELLHACGEHGVMLHGQASGRDLSNPDDVFILRIEVAHACRSSDDTSRRVKRALTASAQAGKAHGGNRAYGYQSGGMLVDEEEAAHVRMMVDRFLSGWSINRIVNQLNADRVPSARGRRWSNQAVRGVLLSPRIAGLRVHGGDTFPAAWPALITSAQRQAIERLITSRQPRVYGERDYLLRGVIRCGLCKTRMQGMFSAGRRAYRCPSPALGGCGKVKASADQVERFVSAWSLRYLTDLVFTVPVAEPADTDQDDADVQLLADLARMLGERELSMPEYLAARKPVELRRKERAQTRRALPLNQIGGIGADQIIAGWDRVLPDARRAVFATLLDAVFIDPVAVLSGSRFQPDRIRLLPAAGR